MQVVAQIKTIFLSFIISIYICTNAISQNIYFLPQSNIGIKKIMKLEFEPSIFYQKGMFNYESKDYYTVLFFKRKLEFNKKDKVKILSNHNFHQIVKGDIIQQEIDGKFYSFVVTIIQNYSKLGNLYIENPNCDLLNFDCKCGFGLSQNFNNVDLKKVADYLIVKFIHSSFGGYYIFTNYYNESKVDPPSPSFKFIPYIGLIGYNEFEKTDNSNFWANAVKINDMDANKFLLKHVEFIKKVCKW
jgi:hypothetical protein